MTGFTGFENLFRPLHSPLLLCFFLLTRLPPPTSPHCGDNESGDKWRRGVRVIAVIPEPPRRVQEGRKRRPGALMWLDLTGSQPITQWRRFGLGLTCQGWDLHRSLLITDGLKLPHDHHASPPHLPLRLGWHTAHVREDKRSTIPALLFTL